MSKVIRIPDTIFKRLQKFAVPLEDTPADVIQKLLDFCESNPSFSKLPTAKNVQLNENVLIGGNIRQPRQRGVVVRICWEDDNLKEIRATSVSDLYLQVMKYLCDSQKKFMEELDSDIPYSTSSVRYLVAREPTHPTGKPFRQKVEYRGYFMEAHKDYKNALSHLRGFLMCCKLSLEVETDCL